MAWIPRFSSWSPDSKKKTINWQKKKKQKKKLQKLTMMNNGDANMDMREATVK